MIPRYLILSLIACVSFATASEQIDIPALSLAHGIILTGTELKYGATSEVVLDLQELVLPGEPKTTTMKLAARVLCDAKAVDGTNRIQLTAKKIVHVFPSGYVADVAMSGFAVSKLDGRNSVQALVKMNLEQTALLASHGYEAAKQEGSPADINDAIKTSGQTVVLDNGQAVDLVFTNHLVLSEAKE